MGERENHACPIRFSVLYSVFERMDVALYNGSERGIFEQFIGLAAVSEYTDRYYIDLCVVYVLFSHEVFGKFFAASQSHVCISHGVCV